MNSVFPLAILLSCLLVLSACDDGAIVSSTDSGNSPSTDSGLDTDSDNSPGTDSGADTDSEASPDTNFGADTDSEASPDTDFGADTDSGASPDTDFGVDTDSGANPTTDSGTDANPSNPISPLALTIKLSTLGVDPIQADGTYTIETDDQLVVDGSAYEALNGYFPLIQATEISGSFELTNTFFIGLDKRFPTLVQEDGELWLRLTAPNAYSDVLSSLVPASTVAANYNDTGTLISRELTPTGSAWGTTHHEAHVMDTMFASNYSSDTKFSWDMRIGRGGQIASLKTGALGETIPPSWNRTNTNNSPWVDEVWQGVSVDTVKNNLDPDDGNYFIHQAGVYLNHDPLLDKPFYSPQVASSVNQDERSFTTINWGQHAHIGAFINERTDDDWQSHLLYFTRYRDLGEGLIEVSLGFYNYGPDTPNYFNMPWGGVRRTSMEHAFMSNPGGETWTDSLEGNFGEGLSAAYAATGGTVAFSSSPTGADAAMALVFGADPSPLLEHQTSTSLVRYGRAGGNFQEGENDWRNYYVISAIRKYALSAGRGVWARYYFALGDNLTDLKDRINTRELSENATLSAFNYTQSNTPLIGYKFTGSGETFRVEANEDAANFLLYAHPVSSSYPIYEIIESNNSRYLTWNPYVSGTTKTYDGTIAGIRLLGFVLTAENTSDDFDYNSMSSIMSSVPANYKAAGKNLYVR